MYTSGRTVKSRAAKPTAIVAATADVRKLVRKHLTGVNGVTVASTMTADPVTFASQIRTVMTFPSNVDPGQAFCLALLDLPNLVKADTDGYLTYTIIRSA